MHRPTIIAIGLALYLAGSGSAQSAPAFTNTTPPEESLKEDISTVPEIREIGPPLYYLEDDQGQLRPALGFTLEEFRRAYDQLHGLGCESRRPGFVIRKLDIDGQAEDRLARLTVSCEVVFQEGGVFRVPLALGQAVIDGDPEYDGNGTPLVHFLENGGGYAVWLEGEAGSRHRLTLKVLAPLKISGDQSTLRLAVPSATASEMRLVVPLSEAAVTASEGTLTSTLPTDEGRKTELILQGLRGDFEATWHKHETSAKATPVVLESSGEILATIDSRGIQWNATLRIQGHGGAFDRFQVRLPLAAELLTSGGEDYRVVRVREDDEADRHQGQVVEVQLREKTLGPLTLHLTARRPIDEAMFGDWVEIAGFGVVGAARQSGYLAAQVGDDLEVLFNPQWGVRESDELPETLANENIVAGFEYATVSGSLLARVAPSRTRISVEPQYVVVVGVEQIQLTSVFRYVVRGKKVRVLDLDLAGWEYDEIGPDNLVAVDKVMEDDSGILSIPLSRTSSSRMEITLRAHRRVKADDELLSLTFPRPRAAASSPAAVVIVPEDNVQLTVDADATKGLLRQQASPPMTVPRRQQTPMFYRGDPEKAVFVARREVHAREIAVRSTTIVDLDTRAGEVKQRFAYKIDYEPRDFLTLRVPREVVDSDQLEFRVDGQRVSPTSLTKSPIAESVEGNGSVQIQVDLGQPRIGMCNLEVRYPLAPHRLAPRSSLRRVVPVVTPLDGTLLGNRLIATSPSELKLAMMEGPWKKQSSTTAASSNVADRGQSVLEFVADGPVGEAELALWLEARELTHATVVQRALVQTWMTRRLRRDRAVFHFTTHEKSLLLILPEQSVLAETRVLLNGKPVQKSPVDDRSFRLDLPEGLAGQPCLLEVDSHDSNLRAIRGRLTLELPRLGESTWVRRLYWQLTLPKNEHVIDAPAGLVREFRWENNGLFWGRNPLMNTNDLEAWVGLPTESEGSAGRDSYLFSAFGRSQRFELVVAGRSWIVLGASGVALLIGMILIYLPASRHPAGLAALAVVVGCTGLLHPEPTLLALQAASAGLALTLVAGLLKRGATRQRGGRGSLETSGSRIELGSTQTQFIVSSPSDGSTTTPLERPPANQSSSSVSRTDLEN